MYCVQKCEAGNVHKTAPAERIRTIGNALWNFSQNCCVLPKRTKLCGNAYFTCRRLPCDRALTTVQFFLSLWGDPPLLPSPPPPLIVPLMFPKTEGTKFTHVYKIDAHQPLCPLTFSDIISYAKKSFNLLGESLAAAAAPSTPHT